MDVHLKSFGPPLALVLFSDKKIVVLTIFGGKFTQLFFEKMYLGDSRVLGRGVKIRYVPNRFNGGRGGKFPRESF